MKLVKDGARFEIWTPPEFLRYQLQIIEHAGRISYQSEKGLVTDETAQSFIKKILKNGHESVVEHGFMTVMFDNVSRGFTHELVRHRLAAFTQESTRYVDYAKGSDEIDLTGISMNFIIPPDWDEDLKIKLGQGQTITLREALEKIENFYVAFRQAGMAPESARQLLPNALKAQIVMSANFREWRHVFELRLSKKAHWEIRSVMGHLLDEVQKIVPVIFDDFIVDGTDNKNIRFFKQNPF